MKKIKFIVLCLTLMLIPFLSSCFNDNTDSTPMSNGGFARVVKYMGTHWLVADSGEKLILSSSSIALIDKAGIKLDNIDKAYIMYTLVEESQIAAQASKNPADRQYDVELTYIAGLDHDVATVDKGSVNDTIKSGTIVKLDLMTKTSELYLNNGYLMIAPSYSIYNRKHYFTLFNYTSDSFKTAADVAEPDTLNLYLSHNVNSDDVNNGVLSGNIVSNYPYLYFMSFNINDILRNLSTSKSAVLINVNVLETNGNGGTGSKKVYSTEYKL